MDSKRWFVRQSTARSPALRLICLPYAGGGASLFRDWRSSLPNNVEVVAVQLPGRETRMNEPAFTQLSELLPVLVEALGPLLDQDFALFGHSMGALIAFELARELRRRRLPQPVHLWASGHRPPQTGRQRRPLHALPQTEFIDELRALQGTPEEVLAHPELMELLSPRLRADFALCERWSYSPEPPLDCAVTAFAGSDDPLDGSSLDGWAEQTLGNFRLQSFVGGHFFLLEQRAALVAEIAAELRRYMAQQASQPEPWRRVANG